MKSLQEIDSELFLLINQHHNSFFDQLMYLASAKLSWLPLYIIIALFFYKEKRFPFVSVLIIAALTIALSDQIASSLFKPLFHRLRPCHDPLLQDLVLLGPKGCGGKYGFVSSHAANSAALAMFTILGLNNKALWISIMIIYTLLVSYSRIYLGVHFPGDVVCGMILGGFIGWGTFKILKRFRNY